jgi:hypothetical protein
VNESTASSWAAANQRFLMAALAEVRAALEGHLEQPSSRTSTVSPGDAFSQAARALPAPAALDTLCRAFSLSDFERQVLLLAAGPELDASFATLLARLEGDAQRGRPSFGLALAALPNAHWSALLPDAPLRRLRLLELEAGQRLTSSPLRIDERVLHYLAGLSCPDERLFSLLDPIGERPLPASHASLSERLAAALRRAGLDAQARSLLLVGELAASRAVAARAAAALGLRAFGWRAADVPASAPERLSLARLCERETVLEGCLIVIEVEATEAAEARAAVLFAESVGVPVLIAAAEPIPMRRRPVTRMDVGRPDLPERTLLFRTALGSAASELNGELGGVVRQFDLGAQSIWSAAHEALEAGASGSAEPLSARLWRACRAQARPRLDDLAQRIDALAGWDDIVLPRKEREALARICGHVRQRTKVYDDWGLGAPGNRGLGISALFAGSSGTGKTMAAEVIAAELQLDLYRIDLSALVSKYIGETEKNLRRVFDAAEGGAAVLLFDEADALFGKRSEVKDSHDRYANLEISYLLQRMEAYQGLAVLTTNLRSALDTAFLRRLRFVIEFPFPDAARRREIWRRAFPAQTPTVGLNLDRLAQLNLAGGNIRNIALSAAFLAADGGEPVTMSHILSAARSEYAKLELPLTDIEMRGFA